MGKIKNSYLMWVGVEHYENSTEYIEEVYKMGVSKRLPGIGMALAMKRPGTVVFVAHDDGEYTSCDHCLGEVVCGECRVRDHKIAKLQAEADRVRLQFKGEKLPRGKARIIRIRQEKIDELQRQNRNCDLCCGLGVYEDGTGGYVVRADGDTMDYRSYNYWMRQPDKFNPRKEIVSYHMCENCGGTGKIPAAKIFGCFIPSEVEYILSGRENELVLEQIEAFKVLDMEVVAMEEERKCGTRHSGFYVVTRPRTKGTKRIGDAIKELVDAGIIKEPSIEVVGDFAHFVKPVLVDGLKRFRGVKRFPMNRLLEDQAEMVLEAVNG